MYIIGYFHRLGVLSLKLKVYDIDNEIFVRTLHVVTSNCYSIDNRILFIVQLHYYDRIRLYNSYLFNKNKTDANKFLKNVTQKVTNVVSTRKL